MKLRSWSSVVLLAGCGRFGFGDRDATGDAARGDGRMGDVLISDTGSAGICHTGTWGTPTLLAEIATPSEERGPSISRDDLTLYFLSNRSGGQMRSIWQASRASRTDPFGAASLIAAIDTPQDDVDPEISADELTIYDSSKAGGTDNLYWATRPNLVSPFVAQGVLTVTGDVSTIRDSPSLTPDELTMYYVGDLDIQVAMRATKTDTWTWVREVTELDAPQTEANPSMTDDGLEIFFESFRSGPGEVYAATRASTTDVWSAPVALLELDPSGGTSSGSPEISADGSTLYYYVTIGGQVDIYTSTRTCP